jgi:predicted enzyme related to lactoylglutathione lyase
MATTPGQFIWHELMTSDADAAKQFYGKAIGWGTAPFGDAGGYEMWMAGEQPIGGVMDPKQNPDVTNGPPFWMANITTPDVDKTAELAKKLGGKIHKEPETMPEVGRFAVIEDPDGAVFAAFSPASDMDDPPLNQPMHFSWHELATDDPDRAVDFYQQLFGWKKIDEMDMGPLGAYKMFGATDAPMLGIYKKSAEMQQPTSWLHYAHVENADQAAERIKEGGGTIIQEPMDIPGGGRVAIALDPQGAAFAVHSA